MKKKTFILIFTFLTFGISLFSQGENFKDSISILKKRIEYLESRCPETKPKFSTKIGAYEVRFSKASFTNSGKIQIDLILNNLGSDKMIFILPEKVTLIDESGNGYKCSEIKCGDIINQRDSYYGNLMTATVYSTVLTKFTFTFELKEVERFGTISLIAFDILEDKYAKDQKLTIKLTNIHIDQ